MSEDKKLSPEMVSVLEERAEDYIVSDHDGLWLDRETQIKLATLAALNSDDSFTMKPAEVVAALVEAEIKKSEQNHKELLEEVRALVKPQFEKVTKADGERNGIQTTS